MGGRSLKFKSNRLKKEVDKTKKGKRVVSGGGGNPSNFYRATRAGAGGGGGETVTLADGSKVTFKGTDAQFKSAFGNNFSRENVAKMFGIKSTAGSTPTTATISLSGNQIKAAIDHKGYTANLRFEKQRNGNTVFHGDRMFAKAGSNAQGDAIKNLSRGIKFGYEKLGLGTVKVGTAAGGAGNRSLLGSSIWARMGLNAPLSRVFPSGIPSGLPANLRGAKTVSDIVSTREGRAWWEQNRVSYAGSVNLRGNRNSSSWKLASKFLGISG